jgi:hypothetical protein
MFCEDMSHFPSVQIPNFDGVVPTTTDKSFPIRANGYGKNPLEMPCESMSQFPSVEIPNFDSCVMTTTDKSLPIRADGDAINPA